MSDFPPRTTARRSDLQTRFGMPRQPPVEEVACNCCGTGVVPTQEGFKLFTVPCGHQWCSGCLTNAFNQAVKSKPFRPSHCCFEIVTDILRIGVKPTVFESHNAAYLDLLEEHDCTDKLYCHDPACSAFIPESKRSERVGTCPSCQGKTCKKCKAKSHWGTCSTEKLKEVEGGEQLLALAETKDWKRCPQCFAMIERNGGCPHMM